MKYKFEKIDWDNTTIYSVKSENEILDHFGSWNWTPEKIQEIIDGVEKSRNAKPENEYIWSNEDVYFKSLKYGVFFVDLLAKRAGEKFKKQALDLQHDEFLTFLKDFKKFVEQNV